MMPEDANEWPNEIIQEVFKQIPCIADFEPHVTMDRVDAERGFAFGHVEVQNKTEIQHGAPPDAMASAGVKSARIPIVIKDRKLQPLDLLVTDDSKVLPLTEARLRQAIFRPQAFDITGRGPGDMSMIGQLYPPYRQNYGFGGGGATMNVGMGKESSVKEGIGPEMAKGLAGVSKVTDPARLARVSRLTQGAAARNLGTPLGKKLQTVSTYAANKIGSVEDIELCDPDEAWKRFDRMQKTGSVLSAILQTIRESDYNGFVTKIANDRGLQAMYAHNHDHAGAALKMLVEYEPGQVRKLGSAVLEHIKPTVVQLRKEAEGYRLKTASHACWVPEERLLDRGEAVHLLGTKVVLAADQTGAATMTLGDGVAEPESPEKDQPELISQFGIYKVQDEQGRELIGYVFPNLIDVDGTALPICLFTNGSQMAIQGDIVGVNVGGGASLFEGHPAGLGVFYHLLPNGRAEATVPMTVKATMDSPEEGGVTMHGETFDGRPVQVSVQPNIQNITLEGDLLLVPDFFSWLPLDQAEETQLVGDPTAMNQEEKASHALATVQLRYGGSDSFSVDGFPVDKLASDEKHFISLDETMFLLAGLGADLDYIQQKLGEAGAWSKPVDVRVGRHIKTAAMRLDESVKTAAATLEGMPDWRVDLVKEAAVIPDPVAVDTVLSLGFLNAENLGHFIAYMPVIDEAQMKMCELLLAARLGLREVPIPALESAIRSTEDALEGLKVLAFQKS